MINKFQNKLTDINHLYANYFLCNAFLSLIIFKINKLFFQISWTYLYPIIIILSIIFINQWLFIINNIKNTYLFNYLLYYFLIIKNNIYKTIFYFFKYSETERYPNLIIFLVGFILSNWTLNLFFLLINNFYNLSIILFIFSLILSIFNLIEKKVIFTEKNLKNQEINYNQIQNFLNITNQKFKKNHSLFYIQKRYMPFNEFKSYVKKHGIAIFSSAAVGTLFSIAVQIQNVNVQKEQLNVKKDELNFLKKQHQYHMYLSKQKLETQIRKDFDDYILNKTEKIKEIHNKEYQIIMDMSSRNFWNKLDMTDHLNALREEKNYLKKKRDEAEEKKPRDFFSLEEMKINIDNENINKKPRLDNDFLNDD